MPSFSIDPSQYKLLKRLHRHGPVEISSLSESQKKDCKYLFDCGCISVIKSPVELNTVQGRRHLFQATAYEITPLGRASEYNYKSTFYKWWIPVVISIAATIIALSSLLLSISEQQQTHTSKNSETVTGSTAAPQDDL